MKYEYASLAFLSENLISTTRNTLIQSFLGKILKILIKIRYHCDNCRKTSIGLSTEISYHIKCIACCAMELSSATSILASHCDLQGSCFASRLQNFLIFAILKYIILLQNFRCYRSYWIWLLNKNRWDKKNPFPKSYLGWQSSHADLKKYIGHRFFLPFNRLRQKYH